MRDTGKMKNKAKTSKFRRRLTPRQQRFIEEYLKNLNATQAYLRVYEVSESVARRNAARLLTNADISAVIHDRLGQRLGRFKISNESTLQELACIAFSNMANYLRIQEDGTAVIDLTNLTAGQKAAIAEVSYENTGEGTRRVRIRLANKLTALELLGKYLKLFSDTTPRISPKVARILKAVQDGTTTVRDAALEINRLGLPLPEVLQIELSRMSPEPPPPDLPAGISDEELERRHQEVMRKIEEEKNKWLPGRIAEVADLKKELTGRDSFAPDAESK